MLRPSLLRRSRLFNLPSFHLRPLTTTAKDSPPPTRQISPGTGRQTDLSGLGPKRFYDQVDLKQLANGHFAVTVDQKPVRTPLGGTLAAPTKVFATAVAAEWDAQQGRLRPSSMPLTSLVATARDIVPENRERIQNGIIKFLHTDSVCIRPGHPSELVEAQDVAYGPVVRFVMDRWGMELNIVRGGLSAPQTEGVEEIMRNVVSRLDDYSLAAMEVATGCAKSLMIGVALLKGGVDVGCAIRAARCEEEWQSRVWGKVEGGHDLDDADVAVRLSAADAVFRFVELEPQAFVRQESTQAG